MYDVEIEPDRSRPLGGYAKVIVPVGAITTSEVSLTVYEMFKERFLGQDGWQPTAAEIGPYPVHTTPTHQEFVIGPEIVNQLSEFVPVRLGFGSFEAEVTWPDSVAIAPNAPPIAQVIGDTSKSDGPSGFVDPVPSPEPEPAPPDPTPEPQNDPRPPHEEQVEESTTTGDTDPETPSRLAFILVALVVIGLAIAAYLYWQSTQLTDETATETSPDPVVETPPEEETDTTEETPVDPTPAIDVCDSTVLLNSEDDFGTRLDSLRGCAGSTDQETALRILEAGVAAEDSDALLLFGHLYNPAVTDEDIEGALELTYADNFEVAIDYYSRAREAGSVAAIEALDEICESFREFDPAAAEDFCE